MKLYQHQADLVNEVKAACKAGSKAPCIVLGCGGGKSCIAAEITRRATWKQKDVLFLVHRQELVEQIFKTFVKWGVDMTFCRIGMVQTVSRRLKKTRKPDLIITDENHHSLAASYKKIYEHFSDVLRIGITATPIRLNGDGLIDVNDKLIIGKSTKWLIENNFLAPYDYFAPNVADLTGLHIRMGEYVVSEIERAMIKKAVFGDVIKYYRQLANGKKAVCYCSSVKHSISTAQAFTNAGITAAHIDGTTPKEVRNRIINGFRSGEVTILCNVDLISEGFDVPDCECSILLRPTQSLTLYIQQSMRCMRYRPQKKAIIIDHVGNYARFGMPDDEREWSLEKKPHEKKKKPDENDKIKSCPNCFFTFAAPPPGVKIVCPLCGYVFLSKSKERDIDLEEEKELVKIEGFSLDLRTEDDCNSYSELLEFAKVRGYKKGWAYYRAKQRGFIV